MSIAHVCLAIDVRLDPIQGRLIIDDQEPQPFCGWVELAAAIEAVRSAPGREPDPGVRLGKD